MQGNYGEFMSQFFMNSFLGETMQANKFNPVTLRRHQLHKQIGGDLNKAVNVVKRNVPRLDKYILSKGEAPLHNIIEKSVQAYLLKNKEIADVAKTLGIDPEQAQIFLDDAEAKGHEINHSDTDSFIGDILAAIAPIAQSGIDKIAASRASKGKPAGVFGTLSSGGATAYNQIRGSLQEQHRGGCETGTTAHNQPEGAEHAHVFLETAGGRGLVRLVGQVGPLDLPRIALDEDVEHALLGSRDHGEHGALDRGRGHLERRPLRDLAAGVGQIEPSSAALDQPARAQDGDVFLEAGRLR
jgi:hypothetical protein